VITLSVVGFYEKWSNADEILKKDFSSCIKVLFEFFSNFLIYKHNTKKKLDYITKNYIDTGFLKVILQEFTTFLFFRNKKAVKFIEWNVKSNTGTPGNNNLKLDLTLKNFVICNIKNANSLRNYLYKTVTTKPIFLDTRRKKKKIAISDLIINSIKILKEEEYFIQAIFGGGMPKNFEFVYNLEKMSLKFGEKWQESVTDFWNKYSLRHILNANVNDWTLYLENVFDINNRDLDVFKSIFFEKNKYLTQKNNFIKMNIYKLSMRGRSLLFYLFHIYIEKVEFIQYGPLSLKQTFYQLLLQKFFKNKFLDFGISYCCKQVHNSKTNLGYDNVCVTKNGLFCFHEKNKSKAPNELEKYHYFGKESIPYIQEFVTSKLFCDIKDFNHYQSKLVSGGVGIGWASWKIATPHQGKSFMDLLSEDQIFNHLNPENEDIDENEIVMEDITFEWPKFNTKEKYRNAFLKNFKKANKMACFLRKMCKWITNWEMKKFKDEKMYFFPAIGYFYVIKTKKSNNILYNDYQLCLKCKKMKKLNGNKIFDIYEYCCKECEKLEPIEKYEKILLVNTEEEYCILNPITK